MSCVVKTYSMMKWPFVLIALIFAILLVIEVEAQGGKQSRPKNTSPKRRFKFGKKRRWCCPYPPEAPCICECICPPPKPGCDLKSAYFKYFKIGTQYHHQHTEYKEHTKKIAKAQAMTKSTVNAKYAAEKTNSTAFVSVSGQINKSSRKQ